MVMEWVDLQSIEVEIVVGKVVEVGVENNTKVGIKDIVEKVKDIGDLYHNNLTILVIKMRVLVEVGNFFMVEVYSN